MNRLRAAQSSVVTLTAPAGYGKTTLAAQWAERDHRPVAWLSVDEADDDPDVLLRELDAALDRVSPASGTDRTPKEWTAALARLASRFGAMPGVVLIVDDVQRLRSRRSAKALATLVEHVPPGSTVALVGRAAPGIPIARLRASGRLLELRADDLTLSGREGEALLRGLEAAPNGDAAGELLERCEGWAAGIRLSALAFGDDQSVPGGDDRFLAEYFRSEFLSQLSPDLVAFLRRTSVLERLTAPLCDAVLEQTGSGSRLASLDRLPLLFGSVDRQDEAYRCHPLLRDLLARELAVNEPELVSGLHGRAADWFEAHDDAEAALPHARGSGDVDRLARIVAAIALPTYHQGRVDDVERWLEAFDDDRLERYPAVAVIGVWIHAVRGRPEAAERWLGAAERGAAAGTDDSVRPVISLLRAALCRDGLDQMSVDVERALVGLPASSPWRPTALLLLGSSLGLRGKDALADAILGAAENAAERLGATDTRILAVSERSLLASSRGEHATADAHSQRGRAFAEAARLDGYSTSALELAASARACLRRSHWDEARANLASAAAPDAATDRGTAVAGSRDAPRAGPCLRDPARRGDGRGAPGRGRGDPAATARPRCSRRSAAGAADRGRPDVGRGRGKQRRPTRAELRLLPLLATHLSFREIGTRLFVSRNTVKTQAISVYRKLGVSSRSDAIDHAARLGLIAAPAQTSGREPLILRG